MEGQRRLEAAYCDENDGLEHVCALVESPGSSLGAAVSLFILVQQLLFFCVFFVEGFCDWFFGPASAARQSAHNLLVFLISEPFVREKRKIWRVLV